MHLGFICKAQKLLGKTSVLSEQRTLPLVLGKEGNAGLQQTCCVKGKWPSLQGQSPEDLDFVHSLLPANMASGNINTYKIKAKPNPKKTSLTIYPPRSNSGLDPCNSHWSLTAATAVHATVREHSENCLHGEPKNQAGNQIQRRKWSNKIVPRYCKKSINLYTRGQTGERQVCT